MILWIRMDVQHWKPIDHSMLEMPRFHLDIGIAIVETMRAFALGCQRDTQRMGT